MSRVHVVKIPFAHAVDFRITNIPLDYGFSYSIYKIWLVVSDNIVRFGSAHAQV